jgi:MFS transporter, PHS family, inorganic phosphate transporter
MTLLKPLWHVKPLERSLVESTALLAAALGALLFGRVADMLGRKRIYGFEILVLAGGAIACAFAPNMLWLIGLRFILGVGLPGERHDHERVFGQGTPRAEGDAALPAREQHARG